MSDPTLDTPAPRSKRRRLWPWIAAIAALGIIGVVTAFALMSRDPGPAPVTAASPSATRTVPTDGGRYATPEAVMAALQTAGIDCDNYEGIPDPIDALARGACYANGKEITLGIYASAAEAKAHPGDKATVLAGVADVHVVVGGNWTAGCDDAALCRDVAARLGGQYVHIPR